MSALHAVNPYENFNPSDFRIDLEGWNSERPVFRQLLDELRPSLVIEAGTWKGASAIHMADWMRTKQIAGKILCIDTWLGSIDFWQNQNVKSKYRSLKLKNGFPSVYYQFLYNIIHLRLTDFVVPFPQTTTGAYHWLKGFGLKAPLIYIDASHLEEDVYADIRHYYELVEPGGVLFGDDFCDESPGVRRAVERFCGEQGLDYEVRENQFWIIRKTDKETGG
ncbi:MAG: class I SAM-dependent methyltransferase [Candidatus Omnitrophica bacterium]|nr:class I SAM-dependent methyltransferase [Candidatus Omnitrophota bacterium]